VTVSIGVASLGGCRTEWEHLFQAADAAMYAAKDAGRNQVRVAA
jgi:diguanylate cyclase (GGDEF)-like protein